jgi:hypothetical protein
MKIQKIVKVSGEYARKGEDINPGDKVTIKSEGEWIEGQFGQQFVVKIKTAKGEEKNVNFNQTNINILHDEFGADTLDWIGKEVVIRAKKTVIAGKRVEVYYFVTPNYDLDEYGELTKTSVLDDEPDVDTYDNIPVME